jgi:ubiquinone/menaquinone biosynthesis C-methylase UbiE
MKRLKDGYLNVIENTTSLSGKEVLEIGCGNGSRSIQIAKKCEHLTAIEPNPDFVAYAKKNNSSQNITYDVGKAEKLEFRNAQFDAVLFTLSMHHVPAEKMDSAIEEAVRVTKKGGHIIFMEPTERGTFFDAEVAFDACDGDERKEKSEAYLAIKRHRGNTEILEADDETVFSFDCKEDFMTSLKPKKNLDKIDAFLTKNNFTLNAFRRINILRR